MATFSDNFVLANQYLGQGNLSLAEQSVWSVLTEEPNRADAWQLFGRIARRQGRFREAIDYLNRSLICNGASADSWADLGDVYLATGDLHAAVANYEQALRLGPDRALVYTNLGIALQGLGEWEGAADCFKQAILREPAN